MLVAQDVVRVQLGEPNKRDTNSVSLLFAFPVDSPTPASERFAGVTALRKQSGGLFLASNGQKLCFLPRTWFESNLGSPKKEGMIPLFFISWHLSEKVDDILILWFFIPFIVLKHRIAFNTFDIENIVIKRYN